MSIKNRWLLPEGIEEVLPPQAAQLELLCRRIIDQFTLWGYELVMPPLIEYLESLLTGTGEDLDLQTFKLTDQLSGRMMGVRADTTPQVARIDGHNLKREVPTRLCYLGTVLHTRQLGQGATRAPLQLGAELYGHAGVESDAEIITLMLKTLQLAGINNVHVDLGHVGIYRGLIKQLQLSNDKQAVLFDALQRKATAEIRSVMTDWSIPADIAAMIMALVDLNGGLDVLTEGRERLAQAGTEVLDCIDELERITEMTRRHVKDAPLYVDLAELRGYHYHTGMMFSAYVRDQGQGIAFGGRYDDIGSAFGRSRPATGFSTDIKTLFNLVSHPVEPRRGIFAPDSEIPGLNETIDSLREAGEIVINRLPGQTGGAKEMGCDRELVLESGQWKVKQV